MFIKFFLVIVSLFFYSISFSQKNIEHYYNSNGRDCPIEDARFYSLEIKTDSGWYKTDFYITLKKLQKAGLYEDQEDKIRNGTFYWFYPNGTLKTVGKYVHNKKEGLWLDYFDDKSLKDSLNYKDDYPSGISLSWYKNGSNKDSINIDERGNGIYVSWFDNGNPSSAGRYIEFDKQQGKWKYFHKNGKLSSLEIYDHNKLVDKNYFDENGNSMADTTSNDRKVMFQGGDKAWTKYLSKNLYFPQMYKFTNTEQATVVVTATIDEDGKVVDVELNVPLNSVFDKIAIEALKDSHVWIPALAHNRKIYDTFIEKINFMQSFFSTGTSD